MSKLVINPGSTTVKFKYFDDNLHLIKSGIAYSKFDKYYFKLINSSGEESEVEISKVQFENSPELISERIGDDVDMIGFRVVHGGEKYKKPVVLDERVIDDLKKLSEIAPLHNPPAISCISKFREVLPNTKMYAVFDTSFHQTIPQFAFMYALPYEFYEKFKIRKYGFHGISCEYVTQKLNELNPNLNKTVICHLGGGASVTAVLDHKSVDTSMGFTPLEGVMMATRSGDVDDGVIHYMIENLKLSIEEIKNIENKQSGLLGIAGTDDMRKLLMLESEGDKRAKLAIDMYVYKIQKEIASMSAALSGIDSLVFTAGVGAGSDVIRKRICTNLSYLGLEVDDSINDGKINVDYDHKISKENTKDIWIIPTNEELMIAKKFS